MKATTVPVSDGRLHPLRIGMRTGMLWAHGGFVLAGVGEAVRIPLTRPGGAHEVQALLTEMRGGSGDAVEGPGRGPVGLAALPFEPKEPGEIVVPRVVVGRDPAGQTWVTSIAAESVPEAELVDELLELDGSARVPAQPTRFIVRSVLPPEEWRDEIVGRAREAIRAGSLSKAVLARELRVETDQPIDVTMVLERLQRAFSAAILFALDGFIGASPELLVAREQEVVRAHPLAGTAPRSSDPELDARLATGLVDSAKNRWEHQITIDWLLTTLLPFCSYVDAEPQPSVVTLANVHHLGTEVEGLLSAPAASILELVEVLHPTPAVGGDPQGDALALIAGLERADRGRYAGPTGWVDGRGNGAFAVALRSAQVDGSRASLFAGVGVVADSDLDAELAETRSKFAAMLGALVSP